MQIEVAFYKVKNPFSSVFDELIAWWTNGEYSHVELIINDYMYSTDPKTGIVRKTQHYFDYLIYDYITIDIPYVNNILKFYEMTKGNKYDWIGLVGFIIPFKDRTDLWFCSEWVGNALKISGCEKLFKYEPSKLSPNDLYKILRS